MKKLQNASGNRKGFLGFFGATGKSKIEKIPNEKVETGLQRMEERRPRKNCREGIDNEIRERGLEDDMWKEETNIEWESEEIAKRFIIICSYCDFVFHHNYSYSLLMHFLI